MERKVGTLEFEDVAGCADGRRERGINAARVLLLLDLQVGLEVAAFVDVNYPRNASLAATQEIKGIGTRLSLHMFTVRVPDLHTVRGAEHTQSLALRKGDKGRHCCGEGGERGVAKDGLVHAARPSRSPARGTVTRVTVTRVVGCNNDKRKGFAAVGGANGFPSCHSTARRGNPCFRGEVTLLKTAQLIVWPAGRVLLRAWRSN